MEGFGDNRELSIAENIETVRLEPRCNNNVVVGHAIAIKSDPLTSCGEVWIDEGECKGMINQ
jgi:Zn-finger nucleic acid-binding protein